MYERARAHHTTRFYESCGYIGHTSFAEDGWPGQVLIRKINN